MIVWSRSGISLIRNCKALPKPQIPKEQRNAKLLCMFIRIQSLSLSVNNLHLWRNKQQCPSILKLYFLKVTEISPLDVFYSPLHKAVVRRKRKRRRVDTPEFPPGSEPIDVVWEEIPFNPAEKLTRLS